VHRVAETGKRCKLIVCYRKNIFENEVMSRIFGPKKEEVNVRCSNYIMRNFVICILHKILLGYSDQGGMIWTGLVVSMGEMRNAYKTIVIGYHERKIRLVRA
jgi:hypothetical protein